MTDEIRLSFLGDICPVNRVEDEILTGNLEKFNHVRQLLLKQDLVIANLECPLTKSKSKIKKIGPNLKAIPEAIKLLKYLNVSVAALANNHILDFGKDGIKDTLDILNENGIGHLGAGMNIEEARNPLIKNVKGVRIGLLNYCENEFNVADDDKPGANPFDIIYLIQNIRHYRDNCDILVLYYHGGIEEYGLPTPEMYKNFEFLTGMGIDVIICNHQHVCSGYSEFDGRYAFYGLGNFIFDWPGVRNAAWNRGLILNLTLAGKKLKGFDLIPYEQCNDLPGIIIDESKNIEILNDLEKLSKKLNLAYIKKEWEQFVLRNNTELLSDLFIQNRYLRYLLKKSGVIKLLITKNHKRRIFGYFNCQSLAEYARDSLKQTI